MLGKKPSRRSSSLIPIAAVILAAMAPNTAKAGVIDSPFVSDSFGSRGDVRLSILPAWTGLPGPVDAPLVLTGPTIVQRETSPFVQGGRDTIDTEIVDMQLTGVAPTPVGPRLVELRAGESNGHFGGLTRSGGQVQDQAGSTQDLVIDFPADSLFDVFFDVWIDIDNDLILDVGEVLRNSDALRMRQTGLTALPPEPGTQYFSENIVDDDDPNIGMFNATLFLPGPLDLFPIDMNGNVIGPPHASLDPNGGHTHTVLAEPGTLAILGLGLAGLGLTGLGLTGLGLTGLGFARRRKAA